MFHWQPLLCLLWYRMEQPIDYVLLTGVLVLLTLLHWYRSAGPNQYVCVSEHRWQRRQPKILLSRGVQILVMLELLFEIQECVYPYDVISLKLITFSCMSDLDHVGKWSVGSEGSILGGLGFGWYGWLSYTKSRVILWCQAWCFISEQVLVYFQTCKVFARKLLALLIKKKNIYIYHKCAASIEEKYDITIHRFAVTVWQSKSCLIKAGDEAILLICNWVFKIILVLE